MYRDARLTLPRAGVELRQRFDRPQGLRDHLIVGSASDDDEEERAQSPLVTDPGGGVPRYGAIREATSPLVRVLERELEPADFELARRLRSSGGGASDPHLLAARLIRAIEQERESTDSQMQSQLSVALTAHEQELREMRRELGAQANQLKEYSNTASAARWIMRGIFAAIGIFGIWGIDRVLARTEREGELTIRLQVIEKTLDRLVQWPTRTDKP